MQTLKQPIPQGFKFKEVKDGEVIFEKSKKWEISYGQDYWYISDTGEKETSKWFQDGYDLERLKNHNVYLTEAEAECDKQIAKNQALNEIKDYILDNFGEWKPDWNNDENKSYPAYSHSNNKWYTYWETKTQRISALPYLETEEQCNQLIKDCKKQLDILIS